MRMKTCLAVFLVVAGCWTPVAAQTVTHIQSEGSGIASGVWVGNMLYLSGQLPTPVCTSRPYERHACGLR